MHKGYVSKRQGVVLVHPPSDFSIQPISSNRMSSSSSQRHSSVLEQCPECCTHHVGVLVVLTMSTATASSLVCPPRSGALRVAGVAAVSGSDATS